MLHELMPYTMPKSSVLRWLQKQKDDEDKSRMAASREFQAAGPRTAKLGDSREHGIIRSPRDECRQEQVVINDTGMHLQNS